MLGPGTTNKMEVFLGSRAPNFLLMEDGAGEKKSVQWPETAAPGRPGERKLVSVVELEEYHGGHGRDMRGAAGGGGRVRGGTKMRFLRRRWLR